MKERILNNRKNGMQVLLLVIVLYMAAAAGVAWGSYTVASAGRYIPAVPVIVVSAL